MSLEAIEAFSDLSGASLLPTGNKHCRQGWIQLCCPCCVGGDSGWHLGYNLNDNYFSCYKCGWHPTYVIIDSLMHCGFRQAVEFEKQIFKSWARGSKVAETTDAVGHPHPHPHVVELPSSGDIKRMSVPYWYLRNRFKWMDAKTFKKMIDDYKITATDFTANKYACRLVFPNILDGKIVSFQTRDYTESSEFKYVTAKPSEEVIHHKDFLYGIDKVQLDTILVCEGVMDSLTAGDGAVHTHGIKWTHNQMLCLKAFKKVYVCFDKEPEASASARRLINEISHFTKAIKVKLVDGKDINSTSLKEIEDVRGLLK